MFSNTTFSPLKNVSTPCNRVNDSSRENEAYFNKVFFSTSIITAVLSPIAVAGNALILATIWKKTFVRTPFHILLSGLAFTDLCTGLIAQPFFVATALMYVANPMVRFDRPLLYIILKTTGQSSAVYFIAITVLLITLMSIERWLHMSSRRSLITSCRGYSTVIILSLLPIPAVVFRVLANSKKTYYYNMIVAMLVIIIPCYLTTLFGYFKVYRIIRHHQQQVQANETTQNLGQSAIDLAKYKKSVASMVYILLLFSVCFLPYIIASGVYLRLSYVTLGEEYAAIQATVVLLFVSSSLNPGLYLWRMNDIRNGVKQLLCSAA
ncbi:high-affinity lysophosphatidic acid receptor-like [Oculina patagonica]